VTDTIDKLNSPVLEGNTVPMINKFLLGLVAAVFAVFLIAKLLETCCPSLKLSPGRPSLTLFALLLFSYVILIPGLFTNLFSFRIVASLVGLEIPLTTEGATPTGTIMKSTTGLIELLWDTDCIPGALLVLAYAIVIPIVKLILLAIGESYRFSDEANNRITAQWCIRVVQIISKWACPDMFVYIVLLYLFRTFATHSSVVDAQARLDIGFTCFSIFCLLSTVLSLAIHVPRSITEEISPCTRWCSCPSKCCFGPKGSFLFALLVFACFAFTMYYGTLYPCMGLHLNSSALTRPGGPVPSFAAPIVADMHLDDVVKSEVSLRVCIKALVGYALNENEGTCILGTIMIAVFVVAFTCLDMILLLLASFEMCCSVYPARITYFCEVLKHMSMLDVFLMGILIVTTVGEMYEDYGVIFDFQPGIIYLLLAEMLHYLLYYSLLGCSDTDTTIDERMLDNQSENTVGSTETILKDRG